MKTIFQFVKISINHWIPCKLNLSGKAIFLDINDGHSRQVSLNLVPQNARKMCWVWRQKLSGMHLSGLRNDKGHQLGRHIHVKIHPARITTTFTKAKMATRVCLLTGTFAGDFLQYTVPVNAKRTCHVHYLNVSARSGNVKVQQGLKTCQCTDTDCG